MRINFFLILSSALLFSCIYERQKKTAKIKNADGIISEGELFTDSLFDGTVKYYDSLNNYLGYSTYKYGQKKGLEVIYFKTGKISDSSFYLNNMQEGFAYKFDENGVLRYKAYYLHGRPFGHLFEYDSIGNITHYYFMNFERKIIFEYFKKDSIEYSKGDQIQANIFSEGDGKNQNDFLFLYLFSSPFTKRHYEIGIINSNKKIIFSKPIISTGCFYEQKISGLQNGNKYAVILHTYNSLKKRDDLAIKIID